nr:hypothetical protein [Methylomarinum sp. Ch1-1]MDP4522623.1 hypothetical protein [Methylomarinum sp. Ch1-1]
MNKYLLALCFPLLFASIAGAQTPDGLQAAIDGERRSAANKARDQYRHPAETLTFFDVKDDMTVVEIWPGGGWYTEILAPYLKGRGQLYAAHFSAESTVPYFKKVWPPSKIKSPPNPKSMASLN